MDQSKPRQSRVAVFGAGIAGLSVAHELIKRGYQVTIWESNQEAGGFFRSARRVEDAHIPSEYSWHGMGPWYHNVFDIMREIRFDSANTMYERGLSRPIDFGLASEDGRAEFDDTRWLNIRGMFRMTWMDIVGGSWLMLKTWIADRRSVERYSQLNAAQAWRPWLSDNCWKTWRSSFGPWIGSDWKNVSLHTAGKFFGKQLITKPAHWHAGDEQGPGWWHGARSGWLLLRGPSNECWFDRWVKQLQSQGVRLVFNQSLDELQYDGKRIIGAKLRDGTLVEADYYAIAINPFSMAKILAKTPQLQQQEQLQLFDPLVAQGPHVQVSLRIAFAERIHWPRPRCAVVVASSEYDLTLFAQEQAWAPEVDLGSDVPSLWTITACVSSEPGRLHGIALEHCTKQQFIDEVKVQLYACSGLNQLIRRANQGKCLCDFKIRNIEVWHEWEFSPDGIRGQQPKWVNRTGNQQYLPTQRTPVPNLVLAGAHTVTDVDVWSIEAAVESGRRAAQIIEPSVRVLGQYHPAWLRVLQAVDNWLYRFGMPHLLDVLLLALIAVSLLAGLNAVWLVFAD